jgi:hypothetical protein
MKCGCISEVRSPDVVDFYHPGQCCFGKNPSGRTYVWTCAFGRPHLHFLSRAPTLYPCSRFIARAVRPRMGAARAPPPSTPARWRPSKCRRWLRLVGPIATCITPNLFLKHPDATFEIYVWRQMKHFKHAYKTFVKTPENTWQPLQNIRNIKLKHLQHMCENICNIQINEFATCVWKNRWNIGNRSLQHTYTTIVTYTTMQHTLLH